MGILTTTPADALGYLVEAASYTYEASSAVQNDVAPMINVKAGWTVVDVIADYDSLGANSAITVGDGGAAARFITSTATTSAGVARMNAAADVGRFYKYTADDTIDVTFSGSGGGTGTVTLTILFIRDFR